MALFVTFVCVLFVLCGFAQALKAPAPGSDIQVPAGAKLLKVGPKGSQLYQLDTTGSVYTYAPYVLNMTTGSSYEQGFDNGYLLGKEYVENYDNLMVALLGDEWWEPAVQKILSVLLQWQWRSYLSKQLPQEYLDELRGMTGGGEAAGLKQDIGAIAGWGIALANFPGSLTNLKFILKDEKEHPAREGFEEDMHKAGMSMELVEAVLKKMHNNWSGFTCSMFGAWGSRTENGRLFTGRNLDWLKDSGISQYKLVTVHHPPNGIAHATFGWAGIWGAITGMSAAGLTVHEANLESNDITFRGFPWVLRLRHVMAYAHNLAEAQNIWADTNSTVGFNHGIGSAPDNEAIVLETMMGNSAVFHANDPREQDLVINGQQIGLARPEAVYRTNHGYDEYTIQHYMWNGTNAYNNSIARYQVFPEQFDSYQQQGVKLTVENAVSITALVGEKGLDHIYDCDGPFDDASNILSVTFDPQNLHAYAAWEDRRSTGVVRRNAGRPVKGEDNGWRPAACNTYVNIDMKPWFGLAPAAK